MLKKHNKHGPLKWFTAAAFLTAGLLVAAPAAKPVYAEDSSTTVQTGYVGFSAVSGVKVNNVSVKKYGYYHIAFNGNGGNGSIDPMTLVTDETENLPKNVFTRAGYTFTGWKGSDGKTYTDGQSVTNLTNTNDATITMTAQWSANTYTATFNLNYDAKTASVPKFASGSSSSMKKHTDEAFGSLPETDKRKGYEFLGWFTNPVNGTQISKDTKMPADNTTYYAHWKLVNYRIIYDMELDSSLVERDPAWPDTYTVETPDITIDVPQGKTAGSSEGIVKSADGRTSNYFTGWSIAGQGGYSYRLNIKRGSTGNKMLSANWSTEGFRVRCEDWYADDRGEIWFNETWERMGRPAQYKFAKPGTVISGSEWGDNSALDAIYRWHKYVGCTSTTVSPDRENVVYRKFDYHEDIRVGYVSGDGAVISGDYRMIYKNPDGSIRSVAQDWTHVNDIRKAGFQAPVNAYMQLRNLKLPDGAKIIDTDFTWHNDGQYYEHRGPSGFTLTRSDLKTTSITPVRLSKIYWSDSDHNFTRDPYIQEKWTKYIKSATITETDPDGTKHVYSIQQWAHNNTDNNGLSINIPLDARLDISNVVTQPGYKFLGVHLEERVPSTEAFDEQQIYRNGKTLMWLGDQRLVTTLNASCSGYLHWFITEDNFAVSFDANGGSGTMQTVKMSKEDASTRKLPAFGFKNAYADFIGWSTDPDAQDASEVQYGGSGKTDVLPADFADAGRVKTLYAVWKWHDDALAANAKKYMFTDDEEDNQTIFDRNE